MTAKTAFRGWLRRARARRRGFALLTVLLLVMLLAVLVFGFQRDVMRETALSGNSQDGLRASLLANMGMVRASVMLRLDENAEYDSLNEPWSQRLSWDGETWGNDFGDETETPKPPEVLIVDEERKFNLLTLVRGDDEQRKAAAEILKRLIRICRREDGRLSDYMDGNVRSVRRLGEDNVNPDTLVRNLIGYLEERATDDSEDLEFSSIPEGETGDVRGMNKQSAFEMLVLGELAQIEGWSNELLHGPVRKSDQPLEARTDGQEQDDEYRSWNQLSGEERFEHMRQSVESADTRSRDPNPIGILPFLTLYTEGRININTASRELLLALDEELTWEAVEEIMTAREQDRQVVREADETGQIPESVDPLYNPTAGGEGEGAEEEDNASFRAADIAAYAAFVQRVTSQTGEEGQAAPEIPGFTEEIFTRMRPWLTVRSSVYSVEVSATVGKVGHGIKALYRRNLPPAPQQPPAGQPPAGQPPAGQPPTGQPPASTNQQEPPMTTAEGTPLPQEPTATLTLLFRDVIFK